MKTNRVCSFCNSKSETSNANFCQNCGNAYGDIFKKVPEAPQSNRKSKLPVIVTTIFCLFIFASFGAFIVKDVTAENNHVFPSAKLNVSAKKQSDINLSECVNCSEIILNGYTYPITLDAASPQEISGLLKSFQDNENETTFTFFDQSRKNEALMIGLDVSGSVKSTNAKDIAENKTVKYSDEVLAQLTNYFKSNIAPDTDIVVYHFGPEEKNNACNTPLRMRYTQPKHYIEIDHNRRLNKYDLRIGNQKIETKTTNDGVFESNSGAVIMDKITEFYAAGLSRPAGECDNYTILGDLVYKMKSSIENSKATNITHINYLLAIDGGFDWSKNNLVVNEIDELYTDRLDLIASGTTTLSPPPPSLCASTADTFTVIGTQRLNYAYTHKLSNLFNKLFNPCTVSVHGAW